MKALAAGSIALPRERVRDHASSVSVFEATWP